MESNRIIVISDTDNLRVSRAVDVYHQNFPEMRIRGPSARLAAEKLAEQLVYSLDAVCDPFHRDPVRHAIADALAFVARKETAHHGQEP